jgi:hypothetical protein
VSGDDGMDDENNDDGQREDDENLDIDMDEVIDILREF